MNDKKTLQEQSAEVRAVADDQAAESTKNWMRPGAWVAIVCADPVYFGQIVAITPTHYMLKDASWIADTGRAHAFVKDPQSCTEAEFLGEIAVERPVVCVMRTLKDGKVETK